MNILGLKPARFQEWRWVVALERRSACKVAFKAILYVLRHPGEFLTMNRRRWRNKLRVCAKCPIYDPILKRCRPYTGSKLGCGCYVPFIAMTQKHCWIRKAFKDLGW